MRRIAFLLLLVAPLAAQDNDPSLDAFTALSKEHGDARTAFFQPYRDAKKNGETYALDHTKHPDRTYAPRYQELAEKYPGSAGALKALGQLLRIAPTDEEKQAALDTIVKDHAKSPRINDLMYGIRYAHKSDRVSAFRTIIKVNPSRDVKGNAMLQLGWVLKTTDPAAALEVLEEVRDEYRDAGRGKYADKAVAEIYEIENLSVGKMAPDIEGEDIYGEPLKLSDYRGKVILLDFWGDW